MAVGPPRVVRPHRADNGGNVGSSRDGGTLAIANPGQAPVVVTGGPLGSDRVLGPQDDVRGAAVSPDGRWAATVSHEGSDAGVFVWEVATGRRVVALKAPVRSSLRFSPDGRWLATSRGVCKLWEVGSWTLARDFEVESRNIGFSPDGSTLAICVDDQVQLYDPASGRRITTFQTTNQGAVNCPAWSPDGLRFAMTDDQSHSILVWDLAMILRRAGRDGPGLGHAAIGPGRGRGPALALAVEPDPHRDPRHGPGRHGPDARPVRGPGRVPEDPAAVPPPPRLGRRVPRAPPPVGGPRPVGRGPRRCEAGLRGSRGRRTPDRVGRQRRLPGRGRRPGDRRIATAPRTSTPTTSRSR